MTKPHDDTYNRDDDLKPGRPPRPATEPEGAEPSVRNDKTLSDPGSGEPNDAPPAPNRSQSEDRA
ncbi:MAG TPA: hypothetical protein VGC92_02995 [Phenylobacterium sp.]